MDADRLNWVPWPEEDGYYWLMEKHPLSNGWTCPELVIIDSYDGEDERYVCRVSLVDDWHEQRLDYYRQQGMKTWWLRVLPPEPPMKGEGDGVHSQD